MWAALVVRSTQACLAVRVIVVVGPGVGVVALVVVGVVGEVPGRLVVGRRRGRSHPCRRALLRPP